MRARGLADRDELTGREAPRELRALQLAGAALAQIVRRDRDDLCRLDAEHAHDPRADLRGDILLSQGKPGEARSAYQVALDRSEAGSSYRNVIQVKLDALGDAR